MTDVVLRAAAEHSSDDRGNDEEAPQRLARFKDLSAKLNLVAIAIELARRSLDDPESAVAQAVDVGRVCQESVRDLNGTPWFAIAGTAMVVLPGTDGNWRELYEKGAGVVDADTPLAVIYYLAAIRRAAPRDALKLQLAILLWLKSHLSRTMFHFTLSRFVVDYWNWAIREFTAHFGDPTMTRSELGAASRLSGEERIRAALRVVTSSLGVRPPTAEVSNWLNKQ